ncbi:MAG: di-heme oxidoredictase family protein [Micropepsaceae bacterium]
MRLLAALAMAVGLAACDGGPKQAAPSPENALRARLIAAPVTPQLGGDTTRVGSAGSSFTFLAENAGPGRMRVFQFGNRLFNTNWVQAPGSVKAFDGLGPLFNRVSCAGCHTFDGRGRPPEKPGDPMDSILVRLSIRGKTERGGPMPHPAYGTQLSDRAIGGVTPEGRAIITYEETPGSYADGTGYSLRKPSLSFADLAYGPMDGVLTSPRVAPQVIGLGLLEAVPDATLLALADPDDADGDGISGRVNRVWSDSQGKTQIGRFGWKANAPTLLDQSVDAALGDIGLTTSVHPRQNCSPVQADCLAAYDQGAADGPEITDEFVAKLVIYTQTLAVPRQRNEADPAVVRGEALFRSAGCAACHVPTLETGPDAALPELANQTFHPFTDLLLHDMGPGLADNRPDFEASGSEWRTPPLWGLGLIQQVNGHTLLLHDGRARGFAEAILWHDGEGAAAREAFRTMPKDDRDALVAFLKSL